MNKIYVIIDNTHAGDDNNARGVAQATAKALNISAKKIDEITQDDLTQSFLKKGDNNSAYFIAAGAHNLAALAKVKKSKPAATTVWSAHQYTPLWEKFGNCIDVAGLPGHILEKIERKDKFVALAGVPHNLQKEALKTAFNARKENIPKAPSYALVMLGGDAPTPEGEMKFYTAEEAYRLGRYMVQNAAGRHLLITNGPRTGKHDPKTGEVLLTHRNFHPDTGEKIDTPVDNVSKAFLKALEESGLKEGQDYSFYDFRFKDKGVDSAYHALLSAASRPDGKIFMAGESVSMVSEVCDFGVRGSVYVFDNGAMNAEHYEVVENMYDQGYFHRIDNKFKTLERKKTPGNINAKLLSAAEKMALAVKTKAMSLSPTQTKPFKF